MGIRKRMPESEPRTCGWWESLSRTDGSARTGFIPCTSEEEEFFKNLAASKGIYERISKSIAPSIYGSEDIKKAIACLLFGALARVRGCRTV